MRSELTPRNLQRPPLRVHHLLAWMTVTAVLISGSLWFDRTARNGPPVTNPLTIVSLIVAAVAISGVLTLSVFGGHWRRKGYVFPGTPGEWALAVITISVGQSLLVFVLFLLIFFSVGDDDWFGAFGFVAVIALLVGWGRLNAAGMSRYADTRSWRLFYSVMIVAPGIVICSYVFDGVLLPIALAAVIACVLFAAWRDVRTRAQRPWTHWVGVGAVVWLGAALIGLSLA
jgi:hypothetical protein